jgi:hypothetical protein
MVEFSMDYVNGQVRAIHREREAIRLGQFAMAGRARRRGLIAIGLFKLGERLVATGTEIRERYAELPAETFPAVRLEPTTQFEPGS